MRYWSNGSIQSILGRSNAYFNCPERNGHLFIFELDEMFLMQAVFFEKII
jgi:hypothetical protein